MASLIELAQIDPQKARKRLNQIRAKAEQEGFIAGIIASLTPDDCVLEIGGNVGTLTQRFHRKGATVISYEADPLAAKQLEANFAGHDNIHVHNAALSDQEGEVELYREADFNAEKLETTQSSTIINKTSLGYKLADKKIPSKKAEDVIQDIIQKNGKITLLYIDINGSELEILEHMAAENLFENINTTYVIYYQRDLPMAKERFNELIHKSETHPEWNLHMVKA